MIKVKIISMARKPKRNHEAYGRLAFLLPKQKELNNANIEQDVELGVTQELGRRGNKKEGKKLTFSGYFCKWIPKLNYSNKGTEEP